MGLCSATSAGANGNIQLCVDPKTCAERETPHLQSSLQQITVRGPLHIFGSVSEAMDGSLQEPEPEPGLKYNSQTSHTLVEVPVEVAVAIALASFLVGAMSTGVLWFLHSKAMQAKSVSNYCLVWSSQRSVKTVDNNIEILQRRLRAEGNELQSMLGYNSAPAGAAGDQNANINCVTCPLVSA